MPTNKLLERIRDLLSSDAAANLDPKLLEFRCPADQTELINRGEYQGITVMECPTCHMPYFPTLNDVVDTSRAMGLQPACGPKPEPAADKKKTREKVTSKTESKKSKSQKVRKSK